MYTATAITTTTTTVLYLLLQQGQLVAAGNRNRTLRLYDITRLKAQDECSLESCCVFDNVSAHGVSILSLVCGDNFLYVFFLCNSKLFLHFSACIKYSDWN